MEYDPGHEIGAATENRFQNLMSIRDDTTPSWLLGTIPAGDVWDSRGVDFFVHLAHRDGGLPVKVPVQIKSSRAGADHFRATQSIDRLRNIILFILKRRDKDAYLRRMIYYNLGLIRDSGVRFDEYYARERERGEAHWKSRQ